LKVQKAVENFDSILKVVFIFKNINRNQILGQSDNQKLKFNVLKSASLLGALDAKELGKPALSFASVLNIIQENPKIPSVALG
jgi:hypothetical protein